MPRIDELIEQLRGIEAEIQVEFDKKRDDFQAVVGARRVSFSEGVAALERTSKTNLRAFFSAGSLRSLITAPLLYAGIVPLVLLDGFIGFYQWVSFPVYGIKKVVRSDYILLDRGDLPYLNAVERLACVYCGYANGLAAWFREVAARTEQFWCPIKHARKMIAAHSRYDTFFEYGDAESYRLGLERLRDSMAASDTNG
jgi:hypothetical protein